MLQTLLVYQEIDLFNLNPQTHYNTFFFHFNCRDEQDMLEEVRVALMMKGYIFTGKAEFLNSLMERFEEEETSAMLHHLIPLRGYKWGNISLLPRLHKVVDEGRLSLNAVRRATVLLREALEAYPAGPLKASKMGVLHMKANQPARKLT